MIKYKNFKFIIDVTYGALKFKKNIYIIYQELKKIYFHLRLKKDRWAGSLLLSSKPKSQIKWNCERKNTYAYGWFIKIIDEFFMFVLNINRSQRLDLRHI